MLILAVQVPHLDTKRAPGPQNASFGRFVSPRSSPLPPIDHQMRPNRSIVGIWVSKLITKWIQKWSQKGQGRTKIKLSYRVRVNPPDALPGGTKIELSWILILGLSQDSLFGSLCGHFCSTGGSGTGSKGARTRLDTL